MLGLCTPRASRDPGARGRPRSGPRRAQVPVGPAASRDRVRDRGDLDRLAALTSCRGCPFLVARHRARRESAVTASPRRGVFVRLAATRGTSPRAVVGCALRRAIQRCVGIVLAARALSLSRRANPMHSGPHRRPGVRAGWGWNAPGCRGRNQVKGRSGMRGLRRRPRSIADGDAGAEAQASTPAKTCIPRTPRRSRPAACSDSSIAALSASASQ